MNQIPTIRLIFDRKNTANNNTKAIVQIEILYNRKRKYISTGVKVFKNQWSIKSSSVINHADADELNQLINISVTNIRKYFLLLKEKNETFSFEKFDLFLSNMAGNENSFLDFMRERIYNRNLKASTIKHHLSTLKKLESFGHIQSFVDLTVNNIRSFDDFIRQTLTHQVSIHGVHKRLKVYVREAYERGYIKENPYNSIHIERGKSKGIRFLTSSELLKIENAELYDGVLERTRDLFIFACYTGIAYSDIQNLTSDNILKDGENYYIEGYRQKTNSHFFTPALTKAVQVLKKYNFKLPVVSLEQYNMRLKSLALAIGLKKLLVVMLRGIHSPLR